MTPEEVEKAIEVLIAPYNDTAKISVCPMKQVLFNENERLEAENKALKERLKELREMVKAMYKNTASECYCHGFSGEDVCEQVLEFISTFES